MTDTQDASESFTFTLKRSEMPAFSDAVFHAKQALRAIVKNGRNVEDREDATEALGVLDAIAKQAQATPITTTKTFYTMVDAAQFKGASYHTVSRAVRRGRLAVTRIGRQALIARADLEAWRPMVERAPRKYRQRAPDPDVTPLLVGEVRS